MKIKVSFQLLLTVGPIGLVHVVYFKDRHSSFIKLSSRIPRLLQNPFWAEGVDPEPTPV
jgi:hypothetical protein